MGKRGHTVIQYSDVGNGFKNLPDELLEYELSMSKQIEFVIRVFFLTSKRLRSQAKIV
jgi:hypothetical protein